MARSFGSLVSDFKTITNDSSTTNDTLGKIFINQGCKRTMSLSDWTFNKGSKTISSGTYIQDYDSPYNASKIDYVNYWYGNMWYVPWEVKGGVEWRLLNQVWTTSSIATHWHVSNKSKQIGLFPVPIDASGTIKIAFTKKIIDYGANDYSTGSVNGSANGTIFSGVGTTWNSGMVGRYLQVTGTNTPLDGYWFEIDSYGSPTSVSVRESIPNDISGASYTIAQLSPFPDGFEDLPLYHALKIYYQTKEQPKLSQEYERMYNEGLGELLKRDQRSVQSALEKRGKPSPLDVNSNPWTITLH